MLYYIPLHVGDCCDQNDGGSVDATTLYASIAVVMLLIIVVIAIVIGFQCVRQIMHHRKEQRDLAADDEYVKNSVVIVSDNQSLTVFCFILESFTWCLNNQDHIPYCIKVPNHTFILTNLYNKDFIRECLCLVCNACTCILYYTSRYVCVHLLIA